MYVNTIRNLRFSWWQKIHCSVLEALEEPAAFIYLEDRGRSNHLPYGVTALKIEAPGSSKTLLTINDSVWCHNPEDNIVTKFLKAGTVELDRRLIS
jgi:hypothetical protein